MADYLGEISLFYRLPLWLNGVLILTIFLVAIEVGRRSALRVSQRNKNAVEAARADMTVGALLALLGLLLAFTYAFGLSRYDQRKEAIISEANALGTAFLRADFLPEPGRSAVRRRLLEYARTRLISAEMVGTKEKLARTLERTLKAQEQIWPALAKALQAGVKGPVEVAVIGAINTVLDVHTKRVVAAFDNIPAVVLVLLVLVSAFSLASTAHNAALQGNTSTWRRGAFAVILAALILLIIDFDMPQRGFIRVPTVSMSILIDDMEAALAE